VAPTTPTERIRLAAERTDGWLYLVSLTGTTGARAEVSSQLDTLVRRARSVTGVPLLAGFGISTPEQAATTAALADGVVVGSRAIEVADEGGADALRDYVASLRDALAYGTNSSAGSPTAPTTGSVTNVSPSTHSIDASAQAGVVHE
jgi:tryptophan synthase alpha chain